MSTVTLKNIRKTYTDTEVIKGIDLEIEDREFVVFVGPSGLRQVYAAADDCRIRRDYVW